jgi:hypothetical protein
MPVGQGHSGLAPVERRDETATRASFAHGVQQVGAEPPFDDVSDSTSRERGPRHLGVVVDGEEHDRCRRPDFAETSGDFEAGHPWHRDVEDDHVRLQPRRGIQGRGAVLNLPDHSACRLEHRGHPGEHCLVVVDQEHPGPLTPRFCPPVRRCGA